MAWRNGRSGAARATQAVASRRRYWNDINQSAGPAGPCVSLVTGKVVETIISAVRPIKARPAHYTRKPAGIRWPIYVTIPTPGGLETVTLKSREHADRLGYTWVGR